MGDRATPCDPHEGGFHTQCEVKKSGTATVRSLSSLYKETAGFIYDDDDDDGGIDHENDTNF